MNPDSINPEAFLKSTNVPKDGKAIAAILKAMGVESCSPKVIAQLLEFEHGYVGDIVLDAQKLAQLASHEISVADVRLAVQVRLNRSFQTPSQTDILFAQTSSTNALPLPITPDASGTQLHLPADECCLISRNFQQKGK